MKKSMKKSVILASVIVLVLIPFTPIYCQETTSSKHHRRVTAAELHKKDMHVHPIAT